MNADFINEAIITGLLEQYGSRAKRIQDAGHGPDDPSNNKAAVEVWMFECGYMTIRTHPIARRVLERITAVIECERCGQPRYVASGILYEGPGCCRCKPEEIAEFYRRPEDGSMSEAEGRYYR